MPPDIRFTPEYESDLNQIIDYLLTRSTLAAERFAEAHDRVVEQLLIYPRSGQLEEGELRSIRVPRTPYRIVYRFEDQLLTLSNLSDARMR